MVIALGVLPTVDNPIYQLTEAHGYGDIGWSETYFLQVLGGLASPVAGVTRHQFIIEARRRPSPPTHIVETLRVSDVTVPGDSIIRFPPDAELGVGFGPPGEADPVLGYFMTTNDASGIVNHTRIYRGWQPDHLNFVAGAPRTTIGPAAVRVMMLAIRTELTATRTLGGITTRYMMKSFQRPEAPGGPLVTAPGTVSIEDDGKLAFVWPAAVAGTWVAGQRIHVRAPRVKCVRGISGIHRITSVLAQPPNVKVIVDTTFDCAPSALTWVVPRGFLHIESYYPIDRAIDGGVGKKDAGRPFYQRRGRRSVRR